MPQLTPSFLFDLESNMRQITSTAYTGLSKKLWWNKIAKRSTTGSKKERIYWILDTAKIERPKASHGGGQAAFEDMVMQSYEIEVENAIAGLTLKKEQIEDLDGNGVQLASRWSAQIGGQGAYWPQAELARVLKLNSALGPASYNSASGVTTFFASNHPVNPFDTAAGTYANLHRTSGGASGAGAAPIDTSVTLDVALANLTKVLASIAQIKMPNGRDPRNLRAAFLFVPTALMPRAVQLTSAKFIAQAAASGGGSADVEAMLAYFGLGQPVECPELGAAFGGSDVNYYIGVEELTSDELGAFAYVEREAFGVNYYGPMNDAQLARTRTFEWTTEGRNVVAAGHPFLLHKVHAA